MKMKVLLSLVVIFGILNFNFTATANWEQQTDVVTLGTETETPGETGIAFAASGGGVSWTKAFVYPEDASTGADEASADVSVNYRKKWYKWVSEDSNIPNQDFTFHLDYDVEWEIAGNSNNGSISAGTSSAGGNAWCKCDCEPDDADGDTDSDSYWDGSKTEGVDLTGLGISIWGVSASWDNVDDEWGDETETAANTTTWDGIMDNDEGSGPEDEVAVYAKSRCDSSSSGDTDAISATSEVHVNPASFTFECGG